MPDTVTTERMAGRSLPKTAPNIFMALSRLHDRTIRLKLKRPVGFVLRAIGGVKVVQAADPTTEQDILDAGVGGSLAVPEGHELARYRRIPLRALEDVNFILPPVAAQPGGRHRRHADAALEIYYEMLSVSRLSSRGRRGG